MKPHKFGAVFGESPAGQASAPKAETSQPSGRDGSSCWYSTVRPADQALSLPRTLHVHRGDIEVELRGPAPWTTQESSGYVRMANSILHFPWRLCSCACRVRTTLLAVVLKRHGRSACAKAANAPTNIRAPKANAVAKCWTYDSPTERGCSNNKTSSGRKVVMTLTTSRCVHTARIACSALCAAEPRCPPARYPPRGRAPRDLPE
jgi:hypothetical protein